MLTDSDRKILQDAGITDTDQLLRAAAAFLCAYPLQRSEALPTTLSAREAAFLRAGGARGVGSGRSVNVTDNLTTVAAEYAHMVVTALSPDEIAETLRVSTQTVYQRIDEGALYSVESPSGPVCPAFQFVGNAALPGLEVVLAAINPRAHPVAVQRFFLTTTGDLESPDSGQALSPREWLLNGLAPDSVALLACEL